MEGDLLCRSRESGNPIQSNTQERVQTDLRSFNLMCCFNIILHSG
jgi:hypothetical protein